MGVFITLIIIGLIIYAITKTGNSQKTISPSITVTYSTPEPSKFMFQPIKPTRDFMRALMYIGKADGQLREEELIVIASYLKEVQPEHKDCDETSLAMNIRDISKFDKDEYYKYINTLSGDQKCIFIKYAKKIIGTQKTVHPYEAHLLSELETGKV